MSDAERKIVQLREVDTDNALRYSVLDTLIDASKRVAGGEMEHNKCVLLFLDDRGDERYNTRWLQSGMSMSECVALLEVMKIRFLRAMGVVPGDE